MAKKLPLLAPSIHTFEVNGTYTDCEAKRTVFMAIQKMVSAGKYYRIPYHGSSKKGYSYKRKDGGLTITLADYPDFKKRYITLSGVNLARIAGDPSRLSLTDLSPEGLVMQEQAFLDDMTLKELSEALKTEIVIVDTGGRDLVETVINPPKHKPTRRRQIYEQTSSSDSGKA